MEISKIFKMEIKKHWWQVTIAKDINSRHIGMTLNFYFDLSSFILERIEKLHFSSFAIQAYDGIFLIFFCWMLLIIALRGILNLFNTDVAFCRNDAGQSGKEERNRMKVEQIKPINPTKLRAKWTAWEKGEQVVLRLQTEKSLLLAYIKTIC